MNIGQTSSPTVLISGGTGFIGSALSQQLIARGFEVAQLVRSEPKDEHQVQWDPAEGRIDQQVIDNADIVINLAGASIAGGWWTEKRKQQILQSRLDVTSTLSCAIAEASRKPSLFISASAVGYYGDRPNETLDESSDPGNLFLSDVCVRWEQAADPARDAGVRVVHPRFGVVLSGEGGMLPLMSLPFKLALGGRIGGDQHMAWIDLSDLLGIFDYVIDNDEIEGPVNAVAPESTTNAAFTKAMGSALNRPTVIPVPEAIARVAGGQLARELLLPDQRVIPAVLQNADFTFKFPTIQESLDNALR